MPTSRGWAAMAAVVAGYVCGWLFGYPELIIFSAGTMLALFAGAALLGPGTRLHVRRELVSAQVSRGDAAVGVLHVTNAGQRASRALVATDRCGGQAVPVPVPPLAASATRTLSYRLPAHRRGEILVGPLTLTVGDPLGFFRRSVEFGGHQMLLVRPRTVPLELLASGHVPSLDGPDADTAPGGTATSRSLREYVLGDDLRLIHWRTSARAGRLMVRQLAGSCEPHTTVLLDTHPAAYRDDDFETAVDITASVAAAVTQAAFPVSLLAGGDSLFAGRVGSGAVLNLLALIKPGSRSLADALNMLPGGRRSGALVVVTGRAEPVMLERVALAGARYERVRVVTIRAAAGVAGPFRVPVIGAATLDEFAVAWNR